MIIVTDQMKLSQFAELHSNIKSTAYQFGFLGHGVDYELTRVVSKTNGKETWDEYWFGDVVAIIGDYSDDLFCQEDYDASQYNAGSWEV